MGLDELALGAADFFYGALPRRRPTPAQARACRIISHRGERDNRTVFENAYAAFDPLRGSGVWGIEFDVRWTHDLVPVVIHDPDLWRLFRDRGRVCELDSADLGRRCGHVADLHSLVRRYCDEFHLMVELKAEPYPDPPLQARRLLEALEPAGVNWNVLSLTPAMLAELPGLPAARTVSVGRTDMRAVSAETLRAGRAAATGHYTLLTDPMVAAHHAAGQKVGTGFIGSRGVLWREVRRGVDWIFSNQGLATQRWLTELTSGTPAPPG